MVGFTTPRTIKMRGTISDQEIVVLIDCGATHNFISWRIVDDLQLPITKTTQYGLILGSGKVVRGKGVCKAIALNVAKMTIIENFLPLEPGSIDVILGMQWLYILEVTEVDWRALTIRMAMGNSHVTFKRDPTLTKSKVSLKRMVRGWVTKIKDSSWNAST